MEKRQSLPGDKLVLIELQGRRLLVIEGDEQTEVVVINRTIVEIEYIRREWRYFLIPHRFLQIEEATFFYESPSEPPEIWLIGDRARVSLEQLPLGTRFAITKYRRTFRSEDDIFLGRIWVLADNGPDWEGEAEVSFGLRES